MVSTGFAYFDAMYRVPDPWSFETSPYEQEKYDRTIAALPRPRYRRAFEPGCSIGVLTERLAGRVDELVAVDLHPGPLARARERLSGLEGVTVDRLAVPGQWPSGTFDLVVLSEIAYYFDDDDLDLLADRVHASLEPGGDLVLVHWRGATDYPQSGDGVHDRWLRDPRFEHRSSEVDPRFRLDVVRARPVDEVRG
jgi:SAM-dependent methyltransferase